MDEPVGQIGGARRACTRAKVGSCTHRHQGGRRLEHLCPASGPRFAPCRPYTALSVDATNSARRTRQPVRAVVIGTGLGGKAAPATVADSQHGAGQRRAHRPETTRPRRLASADPDGRRATGPSVVPDVFGLPPAVPPEGGRHRTLAILRREDRQPRDGRLWELQEDRPRQVSSRAGVKHQRTDQFAACLLVLPPVYRSRGVHCRRWRGCGARWSGAVEPWRRPRGRRGRSAPPEVEHREVARPATCADGTTEPLCHAEQASKDASTEFGATVFSHLTVFKHLWELSGKR